MCSLLHAVAVCRLLPSFQASCAIHVKCKLYLYVGVFDDRNGVGEVNEEVFLRIMLLTNLF